MERPYHALKQRALEHRLATVVLAVLAYLTKDMQETLEQQWLRVWMGPRTAGTAIGSYISFLRPEGAYLDPETVVRWIPCGPPYGSWDPVWAPVWSPVWAPVPKGSLRDSSGLPYVLVSSGLPYVLVRTGLPYVLGSSGLQ